MHPHLPIARSATFFIFGLRLQGPFQGVRLPLLDGHGDFAALAPGTTQNDAFQGPTRPCEAFLASITS